MENGYKMTVPIYERFKGRRKIMKKLSILMFVLMLAATAILLSGCFHEHDWKEATCEAPKTCASCGETEGIKAKHQWEDATCTEPKKCSECGTEKGDPLGHDWAPATCTTPKTCTVCSEIEGTAPGHDWKAATCTTPKTCRSCDETEGEAKGHNAGDWINSEPDYKTCKYTRTKNCTNCGEALESEEAVLTQLHTDGKFIFSAYDLSRRIELAVKELNISGFTVSSFNNDGTFVTQFKYNGSVVGNLGYNDSTNALTKYINRNEHDVCDIVVALGGDADPIVYTMVAITIACEPDISADDAVTITSNVITSAQSSSVYNYNGLKHAFSVYNDSYAYVVQPA